ncbi:MAG: CvfB family protein [Fimbriimonadaceae bacterium]
MRIGEYQSLRVARETQHGVYLADPTGEEVLLPRGQCPARDAMPESLDVFVYTDSEDRPVATLKKPFATAGEFAKLRVVSVDGAGAFLGWGLDKDLFCPPQEQRVPMRVGANYLVRVFVDEVSNRVTCTTKLSRFLQSDGSSLSLWQPVKIIVAGRFPDMMTVIINGRFKGSLFHDEWHDRLDIGDVRDAFVKNIRSEDGKVAVSLRPQGYKAVLGERDRLLNALGANGGSLPISDKSSPEKINELLGLSKGSFKKLIGALYKEGRVTIEPDCIRMRE